MTNSKTTKRALFSSVVALLLCFTMLLGTTFAWFTDNASTSVNTIQAGTLDIQLLDANGDSLEGKTLAWQKAAGYENETVLWEPGCTYNLQTITIKNNGNLALKYKIEITGIQGSAKLNDVIDWKINTTNSVSDLGADHSLAAGASDTLTISGTMKTTAGNDYQGLTIDGIAIKVLATQDTVEYDSNNNQYDKDAAYPVISIENLEGDRADALDVASGNSLTMDMKGHEINNNVTSSGNIVLENGTINATKADANENSAGFENYGGFAELNNVNINAGDDIANMSVGDYAVILGSSAELTEVNVASKGGGVGVTNGAKAVFNSGSVYVDSAATAGRYLFYVVGDGSELTINGGKFSWDPADNNKRAYVYASAGTTVNITGGEFGKASTRSGYTAGILGDGTVTITGGTFGFDPSAWVPTGYVATQNGSTWIVSAE